MIGALIRISWLNLKRDRVALALTFVLPVVFLSIFAVIFGGMGGGGGGTRAIRVAAVDLDDTSVSRRFVEELATQEGLRVLTAPPVTEAAPNPPLFSEAQARERVRDGTDHVAVIIPKGFGAGFGNFGEGGARVEVVHDPSNPIALYTVQGLLQAAAMMAAPDVLMDKGLEQLETFGGALTPGQRRAVDDLKAFLNDPPSASESADGETAGEDASPAFTGLVAVDAVSSRADGEGDRDGGSVVTYYAAGIGVMFLLFSLAGAAGSLLEEEETGTLERVLTSRVGMGSLLTANWLFYAMVGVVQLVVMFLWATWVFGLDLFTANHLVGFIAMAVVTSVAAAAFCIMLATICRSRGQMSGLSTIIILIMSALGGSMVPRFVMPAFMDVTALFTFNGWALDGFLKVFWYDDPSASVAASLIDLVPQLSVLAGMTAVFLVVARILARRWETV